MSASQAVVVSPDEGEVYSIGPLHIVSRVLGGQSTVTFELYDLTLEPSTVDYHVPAPWRSSRAACIRDLRTRAPAPLGCSSSSARPAPSKSTSARWRSCLRQRPRISL